VLCNFDELWVYVRGVHVAVSSSLPDGTDLWGLVVGDVSSIVSGIQVVSG